jgi:hypothetical protein
LHGPDDYLESNGIVVTETAVGEAGFCCLRGVERVLVSVIPSDWQFTPVVVALVESDEVTQSVDVVNHWDTVSIEAALKAAPSLIASWSQLATQAATRCHELTFSKECFEPLAGYPFNAGAAQRMLFILTLLNRLKGCFDTDGKRTPEGHELYQEFFTGKKGGGGRGALFSDSSATEKKLFAAALTFKHPTAANTTLFCSWHGKVQTPPLRVHFSWPVRADEPLYIVYVGPKNTKH